VLEKDGEFSWINHVRYEEVLQRVKEERNILQTLRRRANWIGHIVSRNCLLKHVIEGKIREG
jgi:replicative superfamily II helicase